ncbi:MAG TPA: purine-nucleoside phosphorylase [Longimicrobiales bacterium]
MTQQAGPPDSHTARMLPRAVAHVRALTAAQPYVALILGSGLGSLADHVEDAVRIPFGDVPGFAPVTVAGHAGALVIGTLEGVPCIALQGRYHMYEGHDPEHVVFPMRLAAELGAKYLIVTNAAGGINRDFRAGDLMLIQDHINLTGRNPLIGPVAAGETRFPDMTDPYDAELRSTAAAVARELDVALVSGVYCALSGPSYETRAEIRMLASLGADAVGMSTVPEVIVARARGIRVLGISLISNLAAGISPTTLSHAEVLEAGQAAAGRFTRLVRGTIRRIPDLTQHS